MAKVKISFVCQGCGHKAPKWVGKCPECDEFNSMIEEVERAEVGPFRPVLSEDHPIPITEVESVARPRIQTGIGEFDRVLGG